MIPACSGRSRATGKPAAVVDLSASPATRLLASHCRVATVGCPARLEAGTAPSTGSPSGIAAAGRAPALDSSGAGTKGVAATCEDAPAVAPDDPSGVVCHESTTVLSAPVMITCTVVVVPSAEATVKVSDTDCPAPKLLNALLAV